MARLDEITHMSVFLSLDYCIKGIITHTNFWIWYRLSWSLVTDVESKGYFKAFWCMTRADLWLRGKGTLGHRVTVRDCLGNKVTFQKVSLLFWILAPGSSLWNANMAVADCASAWRVFRPGNGKHVISKNKNKGSQSLCKQHHVYFSFDSRSLAAPKLWLQDSHLTGKALETVKIR